MRIWIIDTGVDRANPDLAGRIDESMYMSQNGDDPFAPCHSHGTQVAVMAAGRVAGVAKGATVNVARIDDDDSCGTITMAAAAMAFTYIGSYSPRPGVINFSATRHCVLGFCGQTADDAAKYARSRGFVVVLTAGNEGDNACNYSPQHVPELLTVAASNSTDQRVTSPWQSNWGSCVDLFAPADPATGGTSTAAPLVTGAIAQRLQIEPGASPSMMESWILTRATRNVLSNIGSGSPNRLLYTSFSLAVTVSGPSVLGPQSYCSWTAMLDGGQPPYSYEWRKDGQLVGTSPQFDVRGTATGPFDLHLFVRDGVGRTAIAIASVGYDPEGQTCIY